MKIFQISGAKITQAAHRLSEKIIAFRRSMLAEFAGDH